MDLWGGGISIPIHREERVLRKQTYQLHGRKNIDFKPLPPLVHTRVANARHRLQHPVIQHHGIEAAPALVRQFHRPPRYGCRAHVAGKHLDEVRAVLVVQLVERRVCA